VIEQMAGRWKVKAPGLQGLHRDARQVASRIGDVDYAHVRRGANADADRLVNAALDSDDGVADDRAL
jgi:probable phosphoglycerate mutase